jgi:prepilin-type N-terminal cleavage/methylation domain-containing protein
VTYFKQDTAQCRSGFTLIEVVATLILLGILALGVVSVLPSSNVTLATEADRLSSHLRYAQIRAQADTYQWRLVFTDTTTYQIGPVVVPGEGFTPGIVPGTGAMERTLTEGVTASAGTAIRFDSWGRPLSDTGVLLDADQTITLTEGARNQSITILAETGLIP